MGRYATCCTPAARSALVDSDDNQAGADYRHAAAEGEAGLRYLFKKSSNVCQDGAYGVGLTTAQPAEDVERMTAASWREVMVRNPLQFPWDAFGRLIKTASLHALLRAM